MPTEGRVPNLFLIGAQKSGTTTLAVMLDQHPQICMSQPKEPGFLAFGSAGYTGLDGYGRVARASSWVVRSESNYLNLFRNAAANTQFLGEASTWYLSEPGMAARLHEFSPEARILVILRQPAERAYSAWCHARRDNEEPCTDFTQALAAEAGRCDASHLLRYREMSQYLAPLQDYIERFGRERVHIMFYEDLRDTPENLWRECCDFLQLMPLQQPPATRRQNRSGLPRSLLMHRLLRSERIKRSAQRLLPGRTAAWSRHWVERGNLRRFPPLSPAQRNTLSREFVAEVEGLMALTGRDVRHWLPDD